MIDRQPAKPKFGKSDAWSNDAPYRSHRCRRGVTMVEFVISAMLLVTVMTFVTSLSFSVGLVWKDIGHHRVAIQELSNQLEWLTRMPVDEAQVELASLEPSSNCLRTLKEAQLSGKFVEDNLGTRVVLELNWKRRNPGNPIRLSGWIHPPESAETAETTESEPGQ